MQGTTPSKSFITRIFSSIRNLPHTLWSKIISYNEKHIFNDLAQRAVQSKEGYAMSSVGLPFYKFANFMVLTGEKFVKEGVSYGEHSKEQIRPFDPEARKPFAPLKDFVGETLINLNGPEVVEERKHIKDALSSKRSVEAAAAVFTRIIGEWNPDKSIHIMISSACARTIGKALFNFEEMPEEALASLERAEQALINFDTVKKEEYENIKQQFTGFNKKCILDNEKSILSGPNYLLHTFQKEGASRLDEIKVNPVAALIVEGNISTLISCAVLHIASNPTLQQKLKDELRGLDLSQLHRVDYFNKNIRKLKLLHSIYFESLRMFSPALPVVRYASKAGTLNGVYVPPRTYIFILLRRIMHDPKHWEQPEIFNPQRFNDGKMKINEFPFIPFSIGRRNCPASFFFSAAVFKIAIVTIFKNHQLKLRHNDIEKIPLNAKEPRLKQEYWGQLVPDAAPRRSSRIILTRYTIRQQPSSKNEKKEREEQSKIESTHISRSRTSSTPKTSSAKSF